MPGYLNTDLVITSKKDPTALLEQWEPYVDVIRNDQYGGTWNIILELTGHAIHSPKRRPSVAEQAIRQFCTMVDALPAHVRAVWEGCDNKVFDIGFEENQDEACLESSLSAESCRNVAAVGAGIQVTIYSRPPTKFDRTFMRRR